jgi:hypothetical protein
VTPFPVRWVVGVGAIVAAVMALSVSAQTYLSMLNHGHAFSRILAWQFGVWILWALAAPFVLGRGARLAAASPLRRQAIVAVAGVGVAAILVHILLTAQLMLWLQPYVPVETYTLASALRNQSRALLPADLLAFTMLVVIGYAGAVYHRARSLELRESRLETDLTRAQLDALRLEIQPHFLFNTLNAIASLIRSHANERALAMLLGLSELMRTTFDTSHQHTTTLGAEVAFVQRYIDLQRVRFMDRLDVRCDIPAECDGCVVPTFLLQPLVENAFRHGIARRPGRCRLDLTAWLDAGTLHVRIHNDGADLPEPFSLATHAGVGLRNTAERLSRLYGDAAAVDVRAAAGGGAETLVAMPARLPDDVRARAAG